MQQGDVERTCANINSLKKYQISNLIQKLKRFKKFFVSGKIHFICNKLRNLMNILIVVEQVKLLKNFNDLNKNNNLKTKLFATYNDSNIFVNVNYLKLDLTKENLFKRKINKFKKYKFNYVLFAATLTNASNQIKNHYCTFEHLKTKIF